MRAGRLLDAFEAQEAAQQRDIFRSAHSASSAALPHHPALRESARGQGHASLGCIVDEVLTLNMQKFASTAASHSLPYLLGVYGGVWDTLPRPR